MAHVHDLAHSLSAGHGRQSLREDGVGALDGVDVGGVDGGQLPPHQDRVGPACCKDIHGHMEINIVNINIDIYIVY